MKKYSYKGLIYSAPNKDSVLRLNGLKADSRKLKQVKKLKKGA